jgi:hypothetical protein
VAVSYLRFAEERRVTEEAGVPAVGGGATTVGGIISSGRGNAASWGQIVGKEPVGTWELALPKGMGERFKNGEIDDILFVITLPHTRVAGVRPIRACWRNPDYQSPGG